MDDIERLQVARSRRNRLSRKRVSKIRHSHQSLKAPAYGHFSRIPFPGKMATKFFKVDCYENQGTRPYMEDNNRLVVQEDHTFIGVYDGHGGSVVAKYVAMNLYEEIQKEFEENKADSQECCIRNSFLKIEDKLFARSRKSVSNQNGEEEGENEKEESEEIFTGGACATIAYIKDNLEVITANVGDCRMVLYDDDGKYKILSIDHDMHNDDEIKRINDLGIKVKKHGRVGGLMVTRAFGDFFRPRGQIVITADPYMTRFKLDPKKHHSIVVASDGLWGNITEKEVFEIIGKESDPRIATRKLMGHVMEKLRDNITICVLYVTKSEAFKEW